MFWLPDCDYCWLLLFVLENKYEDDDDDMKSCPCPALIYCSRVLGFPTINERGKGKNEQGVF